MHVISRKDSLNNIDSALVDYGFFRKDNELYDVGWDSPIIGYINLHENSRLYIELLIAHDLNYMEDAARRIEERFGWDVYIFIP